MPGGMARHYVEVQVDVTIARKAVFGYMEQFRHPAHVISLYEDTREERAGRSVDREIWRTLLEEALAATLRLVMLSAIVEIDRIGVLVEDELMHGLVDARARLRL